VSVRESAFAPGTTVDVSATPSSASTSLSTSLSTSTGNRSRTTSIASNVTVSSTPNSYASGFTNGFNNGFTDGFTNGHANGHADGINGYAVDYTNSQPNGHTIHYLTGQLNGLATNFAATSGALSNTTPPRTPNRQTPSSQHPRASPSSRRRPDLRIVPVYFGGEASLGSDRSLIGSAREENLLATFWQAYLPNKTIFPRQAVGYASGGWTNVVQDLYRKDPVLHYTLMANCFSAAARTVKSRDDSRALAEQSLRAHGRALHELRLALDHPQKARSDSVFSALRLMIVFSVCASPCPCSTLYTCMLFISNGVQMFFSDRYEEDRRARARGWKEHNAGVLALLRARGPEAHISGHGHQMFVDCRLALVRRPCHTKSVFGYPGTMLTLLDRSWRPSVFARDHRSTATSG
jgi:hypothetical protein